MNQTQKIDHPMERNIIKIDEAELKDDLKTLIRGTVEDTLNAMLDEEAADLCNAEKHERSEGRRNYAPLPQVKMSAFNS